MLYFNFINETNRKVQKSNLMQLVDKTYVVMKSYVDKKLKGLDGQFDCIIVDDKTIHKINKEHRHKDKPTDVITFAYLEVTDWETVEEGLVVGDIFISIDTAERQAKEKGHSLKREIEILFVHGVLHALGFDHNNDEEEAEMEGWAKKILD
ncbi:rRNA maturation RNase YbeY [Candidatus Peregrinibacteria bacterium CG10_big_fil_rev_8_21_14_0_10_36_19]|nr:MAG: rRNA maturation RNase YbeY [Candidatus Peregrinibacteria bacterium CG10_big_fil_rev_8_21_14_0_10_36_19]